MSVALLSAVEQLQLLRSGGISARELAEEHIRRIERHNPVLNALVNFDAERVREQARRPSTGRLAGLPLTIKSSLSLAGHPVEVGSLLRRGRMADVDGQSRSRGCGARAQSFSGRPTARSS